ncbi:hypothetical protein EVAR_18364_1 [Eumeta japonica]|uniref:Uncharacterized protein n=1 Tax=Eumeta variegata TaxID=151549 RepID=A0A4C1UTX3_EUMVA|nr:hypothetical protein EVAR_18364_1 [Eumeta japonica]
MKCQVEVGCGKRRMNVEDAVEMRSWRSIREVPLKGRCRNSDVSERGCLEEDVVSGVEKGEPACGMGGNVENNLLITYFKCNYLATVTSNGMTLSYGFVFLSGDTYTILGFARDSTCLDIK